MTPKEAVKLLLDTYHIEDRVYDLRDSDKVTSDEAFWRRPDANSWEHPHVKQFGEACRVLREFAK